MIIAPDSENVHLAGDRVLLVFVEHSSFNLLPELPANIWFQIIYCLYESSAGVYIVLGPVAVKQVSRTRNLARSRSQNARTDRICSCRKDTVDNAISHFIHNILNSDQTSVFLRPVPAF